MNSFISIFNKNLEPKKLIIFFVIIIFIAHLIALVLKILDLNITDNDEIRKYQFSKIESFIENKNTIVVGDSSAGNGFNSKYFDRISNLESLNLSLTGSVGLIGNLGIAHRAFNENNKIKNIIIIVGLSQLSYKFPESSIIELLPLKLSAQIYTASDHFLYYFNLKEYTWHLKYLIKNILNKKKMWEIDLNDDYIKQNNEKFSNNKLHIGSYDNIKEYDVSKNKIVELKLFNNFCKINKVNCLLLFGPIHTDIVSNKTNTFNLLNKDINKLYKNIIFFEDIFQYDGYKMGDGITHIDVKFKKEATKNYYNLIKDYLLY